jgi:hypothetical protein
MDTLTRVFELVLADIDIARGVVDLAFEALNAGIYAREFAAHALHLGARGAHRMLNLLHLT